MRDTNYIVQFKRIDGKPDEEYIYPILDDAEYHFNLFYGDDSGLYKRVSLLEWIGDTTTVVKEIVFV